MGPSSEARLGIGALLVLQILTALAGVALLSRMGPAVDLILRENVYSTEAVEDMLSSLVSEDQERFSDALDRARSNVTEDEEVEPLDTLAALAADATAGDADAKLRAVDALNELGMVNRRSMEQADVRARTLGLTGAWAMALLGVFGFIISLRLQRRVQVHMIAPVHEVDAVLVAARKGDRYRRCEPFRHHQNLGRVADNLNWLLDERDRATSAAPGEHTAHEQLVDAVLAMIDHDPRPTVLGGDDGTTWAVNQAGLELPSDERAALLRTVREGGEPEGWTVRRREGGWCAVRNA